MLSGAVTDATIAHELPGVTAWAARHDQITLDTGFLNQRVIRVVMVQEISGHTFYLQGNLDDYKALPPAWEWRDETWSTNKGLSLSPRPERSPFGSSMFLRGNGTGVICAHFNRLAYGAHGGPHGDWGSEAQWMTAGDGYVRAVTIGDMLQSILRDLRFTKGHMG